MARETPLARNCARWLAGWERERRARRRDPADRTGGRDDLRRPPARAFTVTAKADRIELDADGRGSPRLQDRRGARRQNRSTRGFSPQLTLTAAILAGRRLRGPGPGRRPATLIYIRRHGPQDAGRGRRAPKPATSRRAGRRRRWQGLNAPGRPFRRRDDALRRLAAPQFMGTFGGNYDHLARVWEWHVVGGDEEAAE